MQHSPYKGVQVAEVRPREITEVCLIRSSVEELATRIAVPNLRIIDIKYLHELHQQIEKHTQAKESSAVRKLNFEFHMLIYRTAEMPLLYQIIRNLWTKFPWDKLHVDTNRAGDSVKEHQAILEAIDNADAEAAGACMKAHIENGIQELQIKLDGAV